MGNLYRLPALAHLDITVCKVAAGETIESTSQTVGLSSFSLHDNVASEAGMDHWLPFLRPEHLCELNLPCNFRLFSETIHHIPSFPHVHKLSATMNLATMAHNMTVLSKFPAVQVLMLGGWGLLEPSSIAQVSSVLPVLTEYTGPYETLHLFLRPTLSRINTTFCSYNDFITHLQAIQIPSNVTSLEANFDDLDNASLNAICSLFPQITELRILISYGEDDWEGVNLKVRIEFFEELTEISALPSTLERLALCWEFEFYDEDYLPPSEDDIPEFTVLRDAFVAKCPALTSLWLDGHDVLFRWCKSSDGVVDEETSQDAEDAETMREGFAAFWEARN
ncbi:hypothetical protein C8R44DRAFT_804112 [Mycena epipterygia]|nr:hypothetical protein C8R44DRAFT_804112 [Mycena epipterygia]